MRLLSRHGEYGTQFIAWKARLYCFTGCKRRPMASVFHYTDTAGLLGILSSDTLFATDYRYLNDVSEAGPIRDLIMPILEAEVAAITPKLIENRWLKKEYYDEHGVSAHRLQAEKLYASVVRAADNVTPFFVVSFCKHEVGTPAFEHGLLSQWRGYAEAGGFAIEFDEQKLDTLLKAETLEFAYAGQNQPTFATTNSRKSLIPLLIRAWQER
jgi:hypothetical protein